MTAHAFLHDAGAQRTIARSPESLARSDFEMVVRRLADDLAFGADNSLFLGSGLEYASSRPYQPGDSVRMMNWRLTARTGKPFIKEYEALKRTNVHIVVDTSASMAVASTAVSKHDMAVWIAAGVGLLAQRRMSPVAVIGGGERSVRSSPSLVSSDLWQALEPLRIMRYDEGTRLGERLAQLRPRLARSSVVIMISDMHDPAATRSLREMAQKHDCAVIHTIDPSETRPLRAGFFRGRESETGRLFTGHGRSTWHDPREIQGELARCGVDYLPLSTDQSFLPPLRRFLASRASVFRGQR